MVREDYLQPEFYHFNDDSLWLVNQVARWLKELEQAEVVSLSSFVLIDIGAGCGIIGLELLRRFPALKKLFLIEPQVDFEWFLAANAQSFLTSELYNKTKVIQSSLADISKLSEWNSDLTLLLVSNPPYFLPQEGRRCKDTRRQMCRHWSVNGLREWSDLLLAVKARRHTALYWLSPQSVKSFGHRTLGKKDLVELRTVGDLQIERSQ